MRISQKARVIGPVAVFAVILLASFINPARKITVYLIGDSTMSEKTVNAYPETGWGMPFSHFFDGNIQVDNRAKNGRSTKSFLSEQRWKSVMESLTEGDYVFMQFGHNDEVQTKITYTPAADYKNNLLLFINESRSKKAIPVLITPVSRRKFDASGKALETHEYSKLVRELSAEQDVPLIDLDARSIELYQKMGPAGSALLFNQLEPGIHPNYPNGKIDNTHFNEVGAREIARLVLEEIKKLNLGLVAYIVKPKQKD